MFDPLTRKVYLIFQKIGEQADSRPIYRRAGFNLVQDGSDPDRYIEPRSACEQVDTVTTHTMLTTPARTERIAGIEYFNGRMFEVHAFPPDYYDVG